jgi:hypothetical protein
LLVSVAALLLVGACSHATSGERTEALTTPTGGASSSLAGPSASQPTAPHGGGSAVPRTSTVPSSSRPSSSSAAATASAPAPQNIPAPPSSGTSSAASHGPEAPGAPGAPAGGRTGNSQDPEAAGSPLRIPLPADELTDNTTYQQARDYLEPRIAAVCGGDQCIRIVPQGSLTPDDGRTGCVPYVTDVVDDVWEDDIPVLYVPRGGVITLVVELTCQDNGGSTSEETTTSDATTSDATSSTTP